MTCRELTELLLEYIQGELDPDLCEHIHRHLSLCPPCEAYVETYRITIQLTRRLPAAPMPPELAERLEDALREMKDQESKET
jgi:anti-sigma factor RsiW